MPLLVGAVVLAASAVVARAHPFVTPYGLAITGGRAKLWFLSGGIPSGFFFDAAWRLLEPAYPPGCAALTFGCYGASGICGDWLTQLAPCTFAAVAAVFLASRTRGFARPWRSGFAYPVALVAALVPSIRREARPLLAALLFAAFSVAFFCLAYACSTADETWHLSTSLPRLLWTPALILARELVEVDRA